jgi:hypothetical protein
MVKWYGMNELVGPISFIPAGDGADARTSEFMEKPYSKKLGAIIDQASFSFFFEGTKLS